jgi:hypothetical protein
MTTAAVKADAVTTKICFVMDHPVLGLSSQRLTWQGRTCE